MRSRSYAPKNANSDCCETNHNRLGTEWVTLKTYTVEFALLQKSHICLRSPQKRHSIPKGENIPKILLFSLFRISNYITLYTKCQFNFEKNAEILLVGGGALDAPRYVCAKINTRSRPTGGQCKKRPAVRQTLHWHPQQESNL